MTPKPPSSPLIVVLGATGTGKSQLAVDIALAHNGEIINGDAMQMYAGLPIITNKITPQETCGIPHHLIGNVSLSSPPWTVTRFKSEAESIIKEIRSRGKLPILVGGTHYYTQSLLFEDTLINSSVEEGDEPAEYLSREEIESKFPILDESAEVMLEKLREVDPIMADRWHPKDRRRIQRSLEIYLTTGRKASDIYEEQRQRKVAQGIEAASSVEVELKEAAVSLPQTLLFWVHADPEILKTRLDKRVDKMLTQGLLDEVRAISMFEKAQMEAGHTIDKTSGIWVSIGYKEFLPYLAVESNPEASDRDKQKELAQSIEKTKSATRQYAKRQVKWIRSKLITALHNAGPGPGVLPSPNPNPTLYLLDGSHIPSFRTRVAEPAISLTSKFLLGVDLPAPENVGGAGEMAELLKPLKEHEYASRPDLWVRKQCEPCRQVVVSEKQWGIHVKSRGHRARVRKLMRPPRVLRMRSPEEEEDGGSELEQDGVVVGAAAEEEHGKERRSLKQ